MRRTAGWVIAILLTAAACGRTPTLTAEGTTTTAPTATTGATATTAAKTPERLSASSRLRVDGVGPIAVGMTVAQARAVAGVELATERLPHCTVVTAPSGPEGLTLMVTTPASGRIDLIIVKSGPIATLSGVRVGSTEAEVLAAYPGRLRPVNPSLSVHRLVYDSADRAVVFVIQNSRVATIYSGLQDQAEADEICA